MEEIKLDVEDLLVTIDADLDADAVQMWDTTGRVWRMSRCEARKLGQALLSEAGE